MEYSIDQWRKYYFETDTRYYEIRLQQDLLGDWIIQRSWGGLKNRLHGAKQQAYPSKELAEEQLALLLKQRRKKQYQQH